MAKARFGSKMKLDMMSVTVLLVMSVFGGLVGYQLGKATSAAQSLSLREAATMMKEKGAEMKEVGTMMGQKGRLYQDYDLTQKAGMMAQDGSSMMDKGTSMVGMMNGF
ncbi:hypothetical protein A2Z00_03290 [Candidatus Gottesmanbacteria bacterium RBG_13_45_10]|uniref:Uncharacterized protein n=1 Tax=Candidatus Gottesmanbacteria bacterium RBG_13_45_10 TaxID=1798370 RepID=A0A1F5ZI02_9BACT|nr:MAG: hypothetical protein A2Z00_03290 [Candidatus Gottesmanbacteria bacterium RBG_13_45_10]